MAEHALVFTFRDSVAGNGFLARVTVNGRALAIEEAEADLWIYGVVPAAIAEHGATLPEAYPKFRDAYRAVLYDAAAEAATYEAFATSVGRFFDAAADEDSGRWEAAARALREANARPDGAAGELPIESANHRPPSLNVERLDVPMRNFAATDNTLDTIAFAEAA